MAAEIVAHREFDVVVQRVQIAEDVSHGTRSKLRVSFGEGIEIGNVSAMVPVMVDFHGPGVDVRLECIEGVAERWHRERTGRDRCSRRCLREYDTGGGCGSKAGGGRKKMTAR